jgi:site-specific DNA recombinase
LARQLIKQENIHPVGKDAGRDLINQTERMDSNMSKALTAAVSYIRMSSDMQEASPDQQRAEVAKLATKHGYKIIREYFDKGISGDATEKRVDFQRMIKDADEKGDFAVILCWDQDRFGRFDSIEAGRWIHPLRSAGVWLMTVAQGQIDWNDFTSRMMYAIQQEGKHQYLIDLSRNILRGKTRSAKNGTSSSVPPCGYDRVFYDQSGNVARRVKYGEKFQRPSGWSVRFVLSEDTALVDAVRWIFDTYVNSDIGLGGIVTKLNQRGIKTPNGKTWSIQTVKNILTNRVYTGDSVFGRNRYGKYHHLNNGDATRGKAKLRSGNPITTQGIHETLIDKETFNRVQHKIAERKQEGSHPRYNRYILSGLLRCGHCGGKLAGKGYHKGTAPRYYACVTGQTRPGACIRYQIPQAVFESYVLDVVHKRLFQKDVLKQIKSAIHNQAKSKDAFKSDTKAIQARIAALDKKIAKGTENLLLAKPDDMDALSELLADWRKERTQFQTELEITITTAGGMTPDEKEKQAVAELDHLRKSLSASDPMLVRASLKALISEIPLWFEAYGKQKRLANGYIKFRDEIELLSMASHAR